MNVENIPTYLKEHASLCNFRHEERKGNMTKVPYNPATGYKVYVNKPETFTDFDTARFYINSACELERRQTWTDHTGSTLVCLNVSSVKQENAVALNHT